MPNAYLVACHQFISREIKQAETLKKQADDRGDSLRAAFHVGQIEEYSELRGYMSEHFNLTTQRYY